MRVIQKLWRPELLCIRQEKHLAKLLDLDVGALRSLVESVGSYCEELLLLDPRKPNKERQVLNVKGDLRRAQQRILKRILLPKLIPSDHSFGGIRDRHIKMNVERHLRSQFAFSCDITEFYPTIHSSRVYRFFTDGQECSPDVARLLTRLCTYDYHLALGLITSPLLADQLLKPIDKRIASLAESHNLEYTRYVDDITLSGPFDLRSSGFPATIRKILATNGFCRSDTKDQFGRVGDPEVLITKIRVNRGHLDVSRKYLDDLLLQMDDLRRLSQGDKFTGPYFTRGQIWGKVNFVCWVNPGRRRVLQKFFLSIPWKKVAVEAERRGLVVCKKLLTPKKNEDLIPIINRPGELASNV